MWRTPSAPTVDFDSMSVVEVISVDASAREQYPPIPRMAAPEQESATELVSRARAGDRLAWSGIVDRYGPLVWSICRRYRLSLADADDVRGTVWLRLVEQLDAIRDPAALPGWLATTTTRACLELYRRNARHFPLDLADATDPFSEPLDGPLLASERYAALQVAVDCLPHRSRLLLALLFSDPPAAYTEVSETLNLPVGAIGPTRERCLGKLRRHPRMAALLAATV